MKRLLNSTPILNNVDPNEDFILCTNSFQEGIGGVLMQNGHVIFYELRKLKEHEKKYVTHDLECAAIVHALNMWRNYLMDIKFELRMDHSGMRYLFEKQSMNARKQDSWNFYVSLTLISNILRERITKLLMKSIEDFIL